jgi:chorismate synthase
MRFLDAGESHGPGILTIVEGCPRGLRVDRGFIQEELARRRRGYGRGGRMSIESDEVVLMGGVRRGWSLGGPIALLVPNRDHANWLEVMPPEEVEGAPPPPVTTPRPGHADLAGALKYGTRDLRDILERASARETVGRVCAGALAKLLLRRAGIEVGSHVLRVGEVEAATGEIGAFAELWKAEEDEMRCLDPAASASMRAAVDAAAEAGDTLGGVVEVLAFGVPPGLGSHVHWDRRLDGLLAQALMSIQSVKGVEVGGGFALSGLPGSRCLDHILYDGEAGFRRGSNHAGGIEGGMSNGETVRLRVAAKPIPTLGKPADTVDIESKLPVRALKERADVCAVPALGVVAESMVAWVLANALLEKTGGDSMQEVEERLQQYRRRVKDY